MIELKIKISTNKTLNVLNVFILVSKYESAVGFIIINVGYQATESFYFVIKSRHGFHLVKYMLIETKKLLTNVIIIVDVSYFVSKLKNAFALKFYMLKNYSSASLQNKKVNVYR